MDALAKELETFSKGLPQLLGIDREKYALVKGEELVDTFSNIDDALKRGYEIFGNEPFLVKQILEMEIPQNFTSFQCLIGRDVLKHGVLTYIGYINQFTLSL